MDMIWDTSLVDWEARIMARKSLIPAFPLNVEQADKAERIFSRLRVSDMIGKPRMGEVCGRWVLDFVRVIFGCYDPETRSRCIQEFLLLVPKKNTKSTIAAGIMLTALILNERDFGEYMILAPTKEIADNSFKPAYGMVVNDPTLAKMFKPSLIERKITNIMTHASLAVKAADADVVGGSKSIAVLIDELWLFGKKGGADNILSEVTGALASFPEGFVISLTTQSDDPPAGVFKEKLEYHRAVRDGKIKDPRAFQVIYEFPKKVLEGDDWKTNLDFSLVNPNLGRSVSPAFLASKFEQAKQEGLSKLRLFVAKHANIEIGTGLRVDQWAGVPFWENRGTGPRTLEELCERSDVVVLGIDGGGLDDLLGLTAIGREIDGPEIEDDNPAASGRRWLTWSHAWAHESVLVRHKQIAPRLHDFKKAGDLTIVGNSLEDIDELLALTQVVIKAGVFGGAGLDPASVGDLVDALGSIGVDTENDGLVGIQQGFALMTAIKTLERRVARGTLVHAAQPMMAWCVSNLKIEPTATAIRATRLGVGANKIDPAMAMFNGAILMGRNPSPIIIRSSYEDHGLMYV